jgi:signal transduction histidine kinase
VTLALEPPADDVQVLADRDRVVQVLLSFTDNAIKHSPEGSTVHLRARRTADAVHLEVSDEGPGIEPEQLARVFERFYRADEARPGAKKGGAGLGLAIAKEIVEAHGSRYRFVSRCARSRARARRSGSSCRSRRRPEHAAAPGRCSRNPNETGTASEPAHPRTWRYSP